MRFIRYTFVGGLFWWGCDASPDSQSFHPDTGFDSSVGFYGTESAGSDADHRGCGEDEENEVDSEKLSSFDEEWSLDLQTDELSGYVDDAIWDTGVYDAGEVYQAQ